MSICINSKEVKPGDTFFCINGTRTDGHKYAEDAAERGAAVIYYEHDLPSPEHEGVKYIRVSSTVNALNEVADEYYRHPSSKLKVFGVTGTNGKSTTTNIIRQVYSDLMPCGYIGTINTIIGDKVEKPTLTTPDVITLQSSLAEMVQHGEKAVALEVSAHGLSQGRVKAVDFDIAIFTNFTHDHLDYYGTMENYFEAKKILFKHLKKSACAVLNIDIPQYEPLKDCCSCRTVSYGIDNKADYMAANIEYSLGSTAFDIIHDGRTYHVTTNMSGEYNVYNLLSAAAAMHEAGMDLEDIAAHYSHIDQVAGRLESVDEGQDFKVYIDYAHTPDGYEQVLGFLHRIIDGKGRLITVCGAPGGRDHIKRPELGEIASRNSDKLFITVYDTRGEVPSDIIGQIKDGVHHGTDCTCIEDRKEAISEAIRSAGSGDCVIILGKGDEDFMHTESGKVPYEGDNNVAHRVLKSLR